MPGVRETSLAFMDQCHALCCKILQLFAMGLGLPSDAFEKVLEQPIFCYVLQVVRAGGGHGRDRPPNSYPVWLSVFNIMRTLNLPLTVVPPIQILTAPMQVLHNGSFACCTG